MIATYDSPLTTSPNVTPRQIVEANQQSHIANPTMTFAAGSIDTGTDMTAAEAAQIVTDLAALTAAVTAITAAFEDYGITATS